MAPSAGRKRPCPHELFHLLHAVPPQTTSASIANWVVQCSAAPAGSEHQPQPLYPPSKRRRILGQIQHSNQTKKKKNSGCQSKASQAPQEQRARVLTRRSVRLASFTSASITPTATPPQSPVAPLAALHENPLFVPVIGPNDLQHSPRTTALHPAGINLPPPAVSPSCKSSTLYSGRSRSESPSKRRISNRDDLLLLKPPVVVTSLPAAKRAGVEIHESVEALWQRCEETLGCQLTEHTFMTEEDRRWVERSLRQIVERARECREHDVPETQWISQVIAPMLQLFQTSADEIPMPTEQSRRILEGIGFLDIRTTEISPPSLIPESSKPALFRDFDKKIDLALGLKLTDSAARSLRTASTWSSSINQTTQYVNYHPLFLNVEVKRTTSSTDPLVQLAAWTATEFNKRIEEGWDLRMPCLALEITGHYWNLHVAAAHVLEEEDDDNDIEVHLIGDVALGGTNNWADVLKLYTNLRAIVEWARTEYVDWFDSMVLGACRRDIEEKREAQRVLEMQIQANKGLSQGLEKKAKGRRRGGETTLG